MMETAKGEEDRVEETPEQDDEEGELLESRRLHILRATIESVVKKTVHSVSSQKIIEIVRNASEGKNLSTSEERWISKIFIKLQSLMEKLVISNIDDYFENSGLLKAHDSISRVLAENSSASVLAWRPSGDPHQDMKSHEAENQKKHNIRLQELVEEQDAEIQYLKQRIANRRLLTHNLLKDLLKLKKDFPVICSHNSALQQRFEEMLKLLNK